MSKKLQNNIIVESSDWSAILVARKNGASWDNLKTRTGLTALGMAIYEDSAVAAELLLEAGAPVDQLTLFDGSRWSPLWAAITKKNSDIVDLLLQAGADPDEVHPQYGTFPIQFAAENGDEKLTVILCKHGARPNTHITPSPLWQWINRIAPAQDDSGEWYFPDTKPIISLLKAGARIDFQSTQKMGISPVDLARRRWLHPNLSEVDKQNVRLVLSTIEMRALQEQSEKIKQEPSHTPKI